MNVYRGSRVLLSQWRNNVLALPSVRNYRESENFVFDWDKVPETLEKEKEKFEEYVEVAGEARFTDHKLNIENIEYTASQNPNEWAHVQYLVDLSKPKLIPVPEGEGVMPSGFFLPSAKPGDYPYFVNRLPSWLYPVHTRDYQNTFKDNKYVVTVVRKIDGDIFKLRKDIDDFLFKRYEREFICKVMEIAQKLIYRGNVEKDIKDFLKEKGF